VDALSIADVDFVHASAPKWLFTIEMTVRGGGTVTVILDITADVRLGNGDVFPDAVHLVSTPLIVPGTRTVTNLDFKNPSLVDSYHTDSRAQQRFESTALPSGAMPAGTYTFHVKVTERETQTTTAKDFQFVLTNPSSITLLFPFDGDQQVDQFPLFQWQFDGSQSSLAVFEKLPGQSSNEEVASGVAYFFEDKISTTTFAYPPPGRARSLQPGRTYVWYVTGTVPSAGGAPLALKSPLRSFTVAETGGTPTLSSYLDEVERALDPKYKPIFDRIRSEHLSPTGSMRVNGAPISTIDLLRMINQLRLHPETILNVGLE
jgi:hypothetical protein